MTKGKTTKPDARRSARSLTGPILSFDLASEAETLRREEPRPAGGHSARTLIKHPDFRIVMIVLKTDARLHEHEVDHSFSLQTLAGHVQLHLPDKRIDLPAGSMIVVGKAIPHDVVALQDSTVLLTISWSTSTPVPGSVSSMSP